MSPTSRIAGSRVRRVRLPVPIAAAGALLLFAGCETPTEPEATQVPTVADAPSLSHREVRDRQPLVVEFEGASEFTKATAVGDQLGWSRLWRSENGLKALVRAKGLKPGGVFTFWWVVVQDDGTFPGDIFVALGGSAIVGRNGRANVRMRAWTGDPGIVGLPALGGALFGDLRDPKNALVRVEVAYHGQVKDAGGDLHQWKKDFWTGTACPDEGVNAAGQPHCPVYFASTHAPLAP